MQEKKRIPLKRLHRLRNARKQAAETDDLTPMMKAIKAVHSVTSTGSTQPEDLERQRAAQELFGRLVTPNLLINTTPITVNNVSAEWVRMNQGHDRRHVVLYCHGGGYTCGQLGYARVLASKLALSTGCDVLSFEYRLAPEAPYPSAIDDALRVWDYLMYMGIGARDVIVAGDSAGGNLALELALAVKAQGRSQPCALVLMSPWTDMTMQGASYQKCAALDPMLTHDYIDSCRTAYRGANSTLEWEDPSLSPLFADLRGLPPTLIQVGTNEILKSDSINLAIADGVEHFHIDARAVIADAVQQFVFDLRAVQHGTGGQRFRHRLRFQVGGFKIMPEQPTVQRDLELRVFPCGLFQGLIQAVGVHILV
jgi:epsilon-lactone hydrolase